MSQNDSPKIPPALDLPEILPVLTSSRRTYELRATAVDAFDWKAIPKPGDLLCVNVSPVGFVAMRDDVRVIKDPVERCYKLLELARPEAWYRGAPIGGIEVIPEVHHMGLVDRISQLSSVGVDPFFSAPAVSQL